MLTAALAPDIGALVRCVRCDAPSVVVATGLPAALGERRRVVAYCRACALDVLRIARGSVGVNPELGAAVSEFVREILTALPPAEVDGEVPAS